MTKKSEKIKTRRKYWKKHVNQWKESCLSQAEYCRQKELKAYQLSYWIKYLDKLGNGTEFFPVPFPMLERSIPTGKPIKLFIDKVPFVEIERDSDPAALHRFLDVMRERS